MLLGGGEGRNGVIEGVVLRVMALAVLLNRRHARLTTDPLMLRWL